MVSTHSKKDLASTCGGLFCVAFAFPGVLFPPSSRTCSRYYPVSALTRCTDEKLDLVPGCCTAVAHCSSEDDESNAGNKFLFL